jgi:Glycosyl hydrolase-like 10
LHRGLKYFVFLPIFPEPFARKMMKWLILSTIFRISIDCSETNAGEQYDPTKPSSQIENRIILDEEFFWLTPSQADRTLDRISRAGFNVLVPAVWHGRGVSWPSKLASKEPRWEDSPPSSNIDPLKYLIEKAHEKGIQVHPWFTVVLRQREFLKEFYDDGTPDEAFNIHLPAFRKYIVDVMMEVVARYDVDGINLDYIRSGMHKCDSANYYCDVCVSEFCIADYRLKFGRNLERDLALVKANLDQVAFSSIASWNGAAIEEIIRSLRTRMNAVKPNLILSVDTHAGYDWVRFQGANSIRWANEGLIDLILHMEYGKLESFRWPLINNAITGLKEPNKMVIMVGNYEKSRWIKDKVWPREANETASLLQISRTLSANAIAVALYCYSYLSNEQIDVIRSSIFKFPAETRWIKRALQLRNLKN